LHYKFLKKPNLLHTTCKRVVLESGCEPLLAIQIFLKTPNLLDYLQKGGAGKWMRATACHRK
jgi:hypothetical protein